MKVNFDYYFYLQYFFNSNKFLRQYFRSNQAKKALTYAL